ncbi:hypothetical protein [Methylocapsa sp. S129]|uniref:hypothetical protein n=1 Tax=Methylocapsa sp. S129 TaxID=1641869 RepID=UPI00131D84E9|nr:hypothetical protein [Methylocapsa sp. S129]
MKNLVKRHFVARLLAAALACGAPCAARALDVGPKNLPLTVGGVPVQIPVAGSIDVHTDADAITLKASATGDLRSIQDHALAIARGLKLPRDPCAHKNVNIVVDSIDAATITPHDESAVVDLSGHVTVWLCKKILGTVLKTQIASDNVSISAPVELYVPNPQAVALRLTGPATLKTSDPAITEAASPFLGDVNGALTAQLSKLLDTARARAAVPPMPGLEVTIENATFAQDGPKLIVRANGRATMTSAAFASLLGFLGR